ncbi:PstS family phosphate ABC transporter substrate-binding protein [Aliikangiella coralliicola]|nr:PstS family phosphate ABC transporter substrate-binding protein [Aliikangiella coralliicola]
MSKKITILLAVIIAIVGSFFWLKNQPNNNTTTQSEANESQPIVETLTLKGSNTVGESFAPLLAEGYLQSIGAILIKKISRESPVEKYVEGLLPTENKLVRIDIRAHGSSTGFKALNNHNTEIAMSSRAIKSKEHDGLSNQFGQVNEFPIAFDALAMITHPDNPIDQLTTEQISQIFSGEINNWQQLGGNDHEISLFSRDNNSGTWDTFKSLILKPYDKKLSEKSARFESSIELVDKVTTTPGSLGFVGVAYVKNAKLLKVSRDQNSIATKPTGYTIGTQSYALSRKLYFYTTGTKHSKLAESFIDFSTQNSGQKLTEKVGLISYYPTHYRPEVSDKQAPSRYRELISMGRRITVDFPVNIKVEDTAKEERDFERLKNFMVQNPLSKIVLVDFSSSARVSQIKQQLQQREIEVLDTLEIDYLAKERQSIEVWVL